MIKHKAFVDQVERIRGELRSRHDCLRLDKNERVSYFDAQFWDKVISRLRQEHVLSYPEVEPLYLKLAEFLGLERENIMITAGSDFAIKVAFELFVNPGDSVIMIDPTFAMVEIYCDLYGAEKAKIGYDSDLILRLDDLKGAIGERVSLIMIANPNSPTGTYISNDKLAIILREAAKFSIPVFVDEAYYGFCPYTVLDLLEKHDNLIISRTFSKAAGLAGLRIGYIAASRGVTKLLYKFRPMYEVNALAVLFGEVLLDNWEIVDRYTAATDEGKRYLIGKLRAFSFKTIDTMTNFIHVDFDASREKILNGFARDQILVRGSLGVRGFEEYTRVSVGAVEEMKKVVDSIKKNGLV